MTITFGKGFEKQAVATLQPSAKPAKPPSTAEERFKENCKRLREKLTSLKVTKVRIGFAGSGDSGQFDSPEFEPHLDVSNSGTVSIWGEKGYFDWKEFKGEIVLGELGVKDAVVKVFEGYVQSTGVDWYNNEGGQGYVEMDVPTGVVEVDIDYNVTQTENAFHEEFEV